jgi:hypothetical protein
VLFSGYITKWLQLIFVKILKQLLMLFKITVSSGGMLVQKLNSTDLNSEKMTKFDGTMIYAQNKRQQVKTTTSPELELQFFKNLFKKKGCLN